jgi:hypothetical protein
LSQQVSNRLRTHMFKGIVGFLLSKPISPDIIKYQQIDGISVGTSENPKLRYQH